MERLWKVNGNEEECESSFSQVHEEEGLLSRVQSNGTDLSAKFEPRISVPLVVTRLKNPHNCLSSSCADARKSMSRSN